MIIKTVNLNLFYKEFHALKNVNLEIKKNLITGMIGPSGCGKSTLIRVFNRMNDVIEGTRVTGNVIIDERRYLFAALRLNNAKEKSRHGVPET